MEPFRREGDRVRVSVDGGGQPKWRGDGKELFFAGLDGRLMSVGFRLVADRPEVDLPKALFPIGGFSGPNYDDYAPSADGQRFLVKVAVDAVQARADARGDELDVARRVRRCPPRRGQR